MPVVKPSGLLHIILHGLIKKAAYYSRLLKKEKKCDLVICLSHLGFKYSHNKVSDLVLAKNTRNIDLIIGGHTHTFLKNPVVLKNINQKQVLINQVGWAGINLGKIDFHFSENGEEKEVSIFILDCEGSSSAER